MGICDDDRSQAPSIPDGDGNTSAAAEDEEWTVDPPEEQQRQQLHHDDVWAQAEGYTPLSDVQYSSLMVTMGSPDISEDEDSQDNDGVQRIQHGGAFFVDPSAFSSYTNDDDNQEEAGDGVGRMYDTSASALSSIDDFEAIAGRALSLLDEEYERTIRYERNTPKEDDDTIRPPGFEVTTATTKTDESIPHGRLCEEEQDTQHNPSTYNEQSLFTENDGFEPEWDKPKGNSETGGTIPSSELSTTEKRSVSVDTEAVRKIVRALSLQADNPFQRKFNEWEQKHLSLPPTHPLIPQTPYRAFQRKTDKAKHATALLSRSATLAEVLCRLYEKEMLPTMTDPTGKTTTLIMDFVGVDHVECGSIERIQSTFRPIIRWMGVWKGCHYQHVIFRLIGRELANTIPIPVDLLTPNVTPTKLHSAYATCHTGIYHTWLDESDDDSSPVAATRRPPPHIVIAYNSGIWGYNEWLPTIQYLAERIETSIPFVSTAYTLEECQEDFDVIEGVVNKVKNGPSNKNKNNNIILWEAQMNPFGSMMIRETKSHSTEYRENAAWQAWMLGGQAINSKAV